MAINKEQALLNLTKAKLLSQVAWAMYLDNELHTASYEEYLRNDATFYAMREAYLQCGLLDWDDVKTMATYTIASTSKAD